ncbi:flagellar filament capping protein FliD [Modestobacter sp. SSW1-42]|uniref:flagellar filament capping protein FliD n=1 Tax=Modestobacter sp. SSW1-42 TaxID=596372 RepID=UPI0039861A2B
MSLSTGLISGMDTGTLISQLMQVEANPQTLLKTKLTATQADAAAYRAVNTRFDALKTAAENLAKNATWGANKATSSSTTVTATAGTTAAAGSVTFSVTSLATPQAYLSSGATWANAKEAYGASSITIDPASGDAVSIPLAADATLADAVAAINASKTGVTAAAVNVGSGYRLQLTSTATGVAGGFTVESPFPADATTPANTRTFTSTSTARDAELDLGAGFVATSSTNTFADLVPGVSVTVSKADPSTSVTVAVGKDQDSVTGNVSSLIAAANGVLSTITSYTSATSATATLKGDSTLRQLSTQILSAVSSAVGADGSAAAAGLQLNKDGSIAFDSAKFSAAMKADPGLVQRLFAGTPAGLGADNAVGGGDDVAAVTGIAGRLAEIGRNASDTTTGTLTLLAKSEDAQAKDIEGRIADWDLRLALRKNTLTRQFTAMETALGTLQNQSNWLASQLSTLPSWSKSSK